MAISIKRSCHTLVLLLFLAVACSGAKQGRPSMTPSRDTFRGTSLRSHDKADPTEKIFNVLQFGAKPDGKKDNTEPFMKTWVAACHSNVKARVLIPPGSYRLGPVLFSGPCSGPGPIVVQVSGTLLADKDISLYEESAWIDFENIDGLMVTGRGNFHGQGEAAWKYNNCQGSNDCAQLPSNIKLQKVTNAVFRGITSTNSKGVHFFITWCQNIRLRGIHISAPGDSPNTDGIHISSSNNIKVSKSVIGTGDDCIGMIKGSNNIAINKVVCGPGHGISVGSLGKYADEEDVGGISVKNCTFVGTTNGVRIKTWPGSPPSKASAMIFQDILMNNVRNPIIIDQGYCPSGCNKKPSRVKISNVHYLNIRGTTSSPVAVAFECSPANPCENVSLYNINLKQTGGRPTTATCANAKVAYGGLQLPPAACH